MAITRRLIWMTLFRAMGSGLNVIRHGKTDGGVSWKLSHGMRIIIGAKPSLFNLRTALLAQAVSITPAVIKNGRSYGNYTSRDIGTEVALTIENHIEIQLANP